MSFIRYILWLIIPSKWIMNIRLLLLNINVKKLKYKKLIFLFGVPKHGNLGDSAIISAELKFFNDYFPKFAVVKIPLYTYTGNMHKLRQLVGKNIICISGGGSMGTLWMEVEEEMREIISVFKNNAIIIFPQTIYYEESPWGKSELEKSQIIYNMNNKLHLCAREKRSFDFMKKEYVKNNIYLIPDMVTYLKKDEHNVKKDGILLCLRSDKESVINNEFKNKLFEKAKKYSNNVEFTDTVIKVRINANKREKYLNEKFNEFRKAKLVITDRLHGMLFAAITGTACIALNNKSDKVKGVFEWIKYLEYIHFIENIDYIDDYIVKLLVNNKFTYDNGKLIPYFNRLAEIINSEIKKGDAYEDMPCY